MKEKNTMTNPQLTLMRFTSLTSLFVALTFLSCTRSSEYHRIKEKELASGMEYKEIFLGLEFGMTRKNFFDACWKMNQEGLLTQGANALKVHYVAELPSGQVANMYFYPNFENDRIYHMPVEFQYRDWFPTNPKYSSKNLVDDVTAYFEGIYGKGFFKVEDKSGAYAMVKIDGNRLIRIYVKDLSAASVDILDLRIKDITELKKDKDAA